MYLIIDSVRFFAHVLLRFIVLIKDHLNNSACKHLTSCSKGVFFYEQAKVVNISGRRNVVKVGENGRIRGELLVFGYGGEITIGRDFFLGPGSRIWSGDHVRIGDSVLISHQVNIIDSNSHELDPLERERGYNKIITEGHPTKKGSIITAPIIIDDNVWISFNATVLKGVTIGEGAVVAACSVVTKDVPPYTVVAGNPARVIKKLPQA